MTEYEIKKIVTDVVNEISGQGDITLSQANALIEKVKEKAKEIGVKAVVAVANSSANPVSVQCMDGAFIASYDIAFNKAYTVTSLKMPTSKLSELAAPGGSLYGIQFTNGGRIVIFGGGVPLYDKNGNLVGGLGVSGGSESEDTYLAEYGGEVFSKGV
jgi:uncharacterized protein GlcG (DUF336 family)